MRKLPEIACIVTRVDYLANIEPTLVRERNCYCSQERLVGNVLRTNDEKCRNRAEYSRLGLNQEVRA